MSVLGLALNFRYGRRFVFGYVQLPVGFRSVRLPGIGAAHACFCHNGSLLNVVIGDGLFFRVFIVIVIFFGKRRLPVCLDFPGALVIRLTVLWHDDHLKK